MKVRSVSKYAAVAVAVFLLGLAAPKAAHAITATLVQVVNTTADPVPNLDVERIARIPYDSTVAKSCGTGATTCLFDFTPVPSGYELVVETVSGFIIQANGTTTAPMASLDTTNGPHVVPGMVGLPLPALSNALNSGIAGNVQAFFPATFTPIVTVEAVFSNISVQEMTITGYLHSCAVATCPAIQH